MDNDRDSILFHFTFSSCFSFLIWKWLNTSGNNRHFLWERKNTIQAKMWLSCFFKHWLLHVTPLTQFLTTAEQVGVKSKFIKHWNTSAWKRFGLLLQSVNLHLQTMWADIMKEDIFREQWVYFHKVEEGVNLWRSSNRIPEVELCTPMLKHLTDKHTRHKSKQHACIASEKRKHGAIFTRFLCYVTVTVSALSVF